VDEPVKKAANEEVRPKKLLVAGKRQTRKLYDDFRDLRIRDEVIPIDSENIKFLVKDFVFWSVSILGIAPLLIITVNGAKVQLTLMALFFAFVWGLIFKYFIIRDPGDWKIPITCLFTTGLVGIWVLLKIYAILVPEFILEMPSSDNPIVSLLGSIFQTGLFEETCKALPPLLAVCFFRKRLTPLNIVTMGVFSGLGFAAFENLHYGEQFIESSYHLTRRHGASGLITGMQNAMILGPLRAVSLVFVHGVFSGIVGYFIAIAVSRKSKMVAFTVLGLLVSAVLHGTYNWLAGLQPTLAAGVAGLSFVLFYGYLTKLRINRKKEPRPATTSDDNSAEDRIV